MTISTILFDNASPVRTAASVATPWSTIADDGVVQLTNGKSYRFTCVRLYDRRQPKAERIVWDTDLHTNGRRLPASNLPELRKELLARFKARIEQANAEIDAEEAVAQGEPQAPIAAEVVVSPAAVLQHVITFHHTGFPDRIHRVIVEGAGDRDQAVSNLLADTFSSLVILGCEVLDKGQDLEVIEDELSWVEVPAERRATYIAEAYSQVPAFGVGYLSICRYDGKPGYVITGAGRDIDTHSTLEEAKAAAQALHLSLAIAQVIDLRPGAWGHKEYLTKASVGHLADQLEVSADTVIDMLLAGESITQTARFLRPGNRDVTEDIKVWRLARAPQAPQEPEGVEGSPEPLSAAEGPDAASLGALEPLNVVGMAPSGLHATVGILAPINLGQWAKTFGITPAEAHGRLKAGEVLTTPWWMICLADTPEDADRDNAKADAIRTLARAQVDAKAAERRLRDAEKAFLKARPWAPE